MENIAELVPTNTSGKQVSLQRSKTDHTLEMALDRFKRAYKRLLNFSIWKDLCGIASAEFKLFGADGEEVHRLANVGDYMRIDIPGPGSPSGHGYDWVRIEKLVDGSNASATTENFAIQVRPCADPFNNNGNVAHFLSDHATSTFIVERKENTTTAFYFGRNEDINTGADGIIDKIRNTLVALGSFAGIAETQWDSLLKGLLEEEIGG